MDLLACHFDLRLLNLRRRYHHFFTCVLKSDELIEINGDLFGFYARGSIVRVASGDSGGSLVKGSSVRIAYGCTT